MKKVVLLAVGNDYSRNEWVVSVIPPLSILSVGSFLAQHDVPVELIDVQTDVGFGLTREAEQIVSRRVAHYLRDQAEAIAWIGISQLSNTSSGIILAREIHVTLPETPIIFGGCFPSSSYPTLLRQYPFISAIVRGDGEAAALQISRSLAQGQSFLSEQTPNLAWRENGEIRTTPARPMAVDGLPIPDLRLLHNTSCYSFAAVITSRGCPFRCTYCLESALRPYAEYPLTWVEQHLDHVRAHMPNVRASLVDAIFGINRTRTLQVCNLLRQYGFKFGVESRVDVLAPDLLPSLSQAGLEVVFLGIESASTDTLLRMNKVRSAAQAEEYLRRAIRVLRACFENQVTPILGLMVGFPGDSLADLQATLEFVKEVRQLHDQVTAQTGASPGFIPAPQLTRVYAGSPLAERVEQDWPQATLHSEPYEGEKTVISPSSGLDQDVLKQYIGEIEQLGEYTPHTMELMPYFGFSSKELMSSPGLTDDEGITVLSESVRRLNARAAGAYPA